MIDITKICLDNMPHSKDNLTMAWHRMIGELTDYVEKECEE